MTLFTTSRPTISVKSVTRYPTRITTGTGLSYTYTNGTLNISLDYSDIPDSAQIADPANYTTIVYNKTTGLLEEVQLDYIPTTVVTDPVYTRGDSNFTIPSDYRVLSLVANLTASRTWTLPLAADVTSGNRIFIYDTVGGISATNTLVIAAPSGNTINGASSITLSNAFAGITIVSNSGSQWTAILTNVDSVGGLGTNVANAMKQPVNAANGLVRLDSSGNVPALNGAALTSLNASNIGSGTVPAARLPGPTLSTIGGVKAKAAETSKFVNQIDTDGSVNLAQPAVGDISGFGTGVATALGVNVGSSGAFVTNGGALGTPASGNLANCTFPTLNQNTTGTAAGLSATLGVASGGTGLTSLTAGYIPYGNGTGAFGSNASLFWDAANTRLTVAQAGYSLRLANSANSYGYNIGRNEDDGLLYLYGTQSAACGYVFTGAAGEWMRIASDGSVGIGTSSPSGKLHVNGLIRGNSLLINSSNLAVGANQLTIDYLAGNSANRIIAWGPDAATQGILDIVVASSDASHYTPAVRVDASGNLGLGVTPSAASLPTIQSTYGLFTGNNQTNIAANAYYNGGWKYAQTGVAALRYSQLAVGTNSHVWEVATSGSAGSAISFTQAMTLDASGNLGIGTSSPGYKLNVGVSNPTGGVAQLNQNVATTGQNGVLTAFDVYNVGTSAFGIPSGASNALAFYVGGSIGGGLTERARIDASGNLLVGTTSAPSASNKGIKFGPDSGSTIMSAGSGTTTFNHFLFYNGNGLVGSIQTSGTATAYNTSSDVAMKENISPADSAIASILSFPVDQFDWKSDGSHTEYGCVAQKAVNYAPEIVTQGDIWQVDYGRITPRLIKAFQELAANEQELRSRVSALEARQ